MGTVLLGETAAPLCEDAAVWQSVDQLRAAATRVTLTDVVLARLRAADKLLDAEIPSQAMLLGPHDISTIRAPGTRICFTGTAQDATGRVVERDETNAWRCRWG